MLILLLLLLLLLLSYLLVLAAPSAEEFERLRGVILKAAVFIRLVSPKLVC